MNSTRWAIRHQTIRQQVLGSNTSIDFIPGLLGSSLALPHLRQPVPISPPKFSQEQRVCFSGGTGTIRNCHLESGTWAYAVEMALGPEPDLGRVGSETTILLYEADLQAFRTSYS